MKKTERKIRDIISTIIAYAVITGPVIILVVMMALSFYGKARSTLTFHSPFEKKVYYTIDGEFYHDSKDCPVLNSNDRVYTAYKNELTGKTPCEQCIGSN